MLSLKGKLITCLGHTCTQHSTIHMVDVNNMEELIENQVANFTKAPPATTVLVSYEQGLVLSALLHLHSVPADL